MGPDKRVTAGRALLWHPLSYADMSTITTTTLPLNVDYCRDLYRIQRPQDCLPNNICWHLK